jgi:hypothetical protein
MQGAPKRINICRCGGCFHGLHTILIDMPSRNVRECTGTFGSKEEVKLGVTLEHLAPYLDLLELCLTPDLLWLFKAGPLEGFTNDCGKTWRVLVNLLPGAYLRTEFWYLPPGPRAIFNWRGTDKWMSVPDVRMLLRSLFFDRIVEFVELLREHGLMLQSSRCEMPKDSSPSSTALRSIGAECADSLTSRKPGQKTVTWLLVHVNVNEDGSIEYGTGRLTYRIEDLPIKVGNGAQMRAILDAQFELTYPRFYSKYFDPETRQSRKRKAPKRWGFDEQ